MSTLIANVETGLVATIGTVTLDSAAVQVLKYEPGLEGAVFPMITLYPPDIHRRGVDEADRIVGRRTFDLTWTLRLYVKLENAQHCQDNLKSAMVDIINAIDADQTLAGTAEEAVIGDAALGAVQVDGAVKAMVYEAKVHAYVVV